MLYVDQSRHGKAIPSRVRRPQLEPASRLSGPTWLRAHPQAGALRGREREGEAKTLEAEPVRVQGSESGGPVAIPDR